MPVSEALREAQKRWREKNKEAIAQRKREYYLAHQEQILEQKRQVYEERGRAKYQATYVSKRKPRPPRQVCEVGIQAEPLEGGYNPTKTFTNCLISV